MNKIRNKTFFSYVIPSVLAFALSGVYTVVDGFFVGHSLGDVGLAAITLGYPVSALIGAVGTGIGLSGAIRFTILKAQGKEEEKDECFSGTVLLTVLVGLLLTAVLYIFARPILQLLGAENETLSLAVDYARVIAIGSLFQLAATGFVPFIRNMGGASFAMVSMILGFVTNIVLDYVLVWVVDWKMTGAALATIIGQAVTMLAAILFFVSRKIKIRFSSFRETVVLWKDILKVSVSPFGLTFSPTVTMLLMNGFLLVYGNAQSVAVYGCIGYITSIVYLLLQGVGDGCQPLISDFYGKNDFDSVKHTRRLAYMTAGVITVVCGGAVFAAREYIGILFGASAESNSDVVKYLPYFLATLLFLAFVRITTSYLYATEKTVLSYILVYAEPIFTLLILFVLPPFFKLNGVWAAVPVAQVATFAVALIVRIVDSPTKNIVRKK